MNFWSSTNGPLKLKDREIHIWRIDLESDVVAADELKRILAPQELEKARLFRWERDRNSYIVSRGALRTILAGYLNRPARDLVFRSGRYGKPQLAGRELRFNMSHSDGIALCVVSLKTDVGIDVERVLPDLEEDLSVHLFTPGQPGVLRAKAFFQSWTRSEAYAKARGLGIWSVQRDAEAPSPTTSQRGWWLHDFVPCQGYVAAVAARGGLHKVRHLKWHPHVAPPDAHPDAPGLFHRAVDSGYVTPARVSHRSY